MAATGTRVHKSVTVHETALWREESERGVGQGPRYSLHPQPYRTDHRQERQGERNRLFRRTKTAAGPRPRNASLRNSPEPPEHAHAQDPSGSPCPAALSSPRPPKAKLPVTKSPFSAPGAPTFCSEPWKA